MFKITTIIASLSMLISCVSFKVNESNNMATKSEKPQTSKALFSQTPTDSSPIIIEFSDCDHRMDIYGKFLNCSIQTILHNNTKKSISRVKYEYKILESDVTIAKNIVEENFRIDAGEKIISSFPLPILLKTISGSYVDCAKLTNGYLKIEFKLLEWE
jgi:hypothetical protein